MSKLAAARQVNPGARSATGYYFARLPQAHPSHWQGFSQPQTGEHWQPLALFLEPQVHADWLQWVQRQAWVVLVFMASIHFLEH